MQHEYVLYTVAKWILQIYICIKYRVNQSQMAKANPNLAQTM